MSDRLSHGHIQQPQDDPYRVVSEQPQTQPSPQHLASMEDEDVPYLSMPTPKEPTKMPINLSINIPKENPVDTLIKPSNVPLSAPTSPEDKTNLLVELRGADHNSVTTINATATEDPFILESFQALINHAHQNKKHFIIGRVATKNSESEADDGPVWWSYYNAQFLNKVLFRTEPQKRLLHRMKARNPLNNMPIVGCAEYYVVRWDQKRPTAGTQKGEKLTQAKVKSDDITEETILRRRKPEKKSSTKEVVMEEKPFNLVKEKPVRAAAALSWYWSQFSDEQAMPMSPGLQITFLKRPYDSEEPKASTELSEEEASPSTTTKPSVKRRISLDVSKLHSNISPLSRVSPDAAPLSAFTPDSQKATIWSGFLRRVQERYPGGSPASANVFKSGPASAMLIPATPKSATENDSIEEERVEVTLTAEFLGTCDDFLYRSDVRQIFREQALEADDAVLFSLPSAQKTSRVLFERAQNQEHPELPDVVVVPVADRANGNGEAETPGGNADTLRISNDGRSSVCNPRNLLIVLGLAIWIGLFILFMVVPDPASLILPGIVVFSGLAFGFTTILLEIRRKRHLQRRRSLMRQRRRQVETAEVMATVATSPSASV